MLFITGAMLPRFLQDIRAKVMRTAVQHKIRGFGQPLA
jgi:hypothetical protein